MSVVFTGDWAPAGQCALVYDSAAVQSALVCGWSGAVLYALVSG